MRPSSSATLTRPSSATATTTITLGSTDNGEQQLHQQTPETLVLKLKRKNKKKVTWKEGTVDNEFMQKKSSKKCCIFHKDKPFDEDYSDDEDHDPHHHDHKSDGSCSSKAAAAE